MSNIKSLPEQIEELIKQREPSTNKNEENMEFIDFNKSIENMLKATSYEKEKTPSQR